MLAKVEYQRDDDDGALSFTSDKRQVLMPLIAHYDLKMGTMMLRYAHRVRTPRRR